MSGAGGSVPRSRPGSGDAPADIGGAWWQNALTMEVGRIETVLSASVPADGELPPVAERIREQVDSARAVLAGYGRLGRLGRIGRGGKAYETALSHVLQAGQDLMLIAPGPAVLAQIPGLRAAVRTFLNPGDLRYDGYTRYCDRLLEQPRDAGARPPHLGAAAPGPSSVSPVPSVPAPPAPATPAAATLPPSIPTPAPPPVPVPAPVPAPAGAPATQPPAPRSPGEARPAAPVPAPPAGGDPGPQDRYLLREIKRTVDDARMSAQTSVRSYRNVLSIAVAVLCFSALAVPLGARWLSDDLLTIRQPVASAPAAPSGNPAPTSTTGPAAGYPATASAPTTLGDIASIEAWGVIGGLVGGVVSLRRLRSSRDPAGLHLVQLALKAPAGALTALFGVLLLQSSILPQLTAVRDGQLAAYAVLFGFAQEALTRFVDQKSGEILDSAKPPGARLGGAGSTG